MFLPASAYVPPDTLRAAIAYPHSAAEYEPAAFTAALAAVGLERLEGFLDTTQRWDRSLDEDEKQCLAFARVILQRPQWLVLNGAFEVLDPDSRQRIEALFSAQLSETGVIDFAQNHLRSALFKRTLHLVTDVRGPAFKPVEQREAVPA